MLWDLEESTTLRLNERSDITATSHESSKDSLTSFPRNVKLFTDLSVASDNLIEV